MAGEFIKVDIVTDSQTLADEAVARLRDQWTDWDPNEGDLEVIQIETLAPMAQNAAEVAARVYPAIFRKYGTDLIGTPYQQGTAASTTTTWTLISNPSGRTIQAGLSIEIDGFEFLVEDDVVVATGVLTAPAVAVVCSTPTAAANGLTGAVVAPISALDWVEDITVNTPTANGSDPEDDIAYQDRLSRELQLQSITLVTTRDFELLGLSHAGVGRLVASNNGSRAVLVVGTDSVGEPLSATIKAWLVAKYAELRQVNTTVTVADATYTTVAITYTVKAYPGFDPVDLKARINSMLASWLSPAVWGKPKNFGDPGSPGAWQNETVVRLNKIIDLIGDVDGVNYVSALTINGVAADLALAGTVALTRPGTLTGTIT
jgi:hypothetical protein